MAPSPEKLAPTAGNAKLLDLQQPEKLSKILKEDQYDCLSCRLTGQYLSILQLLYNLLPSTQGPPRSLDLVAMFGSLGSAS